MAARTTAQDSTRPNSTGSTAVWKTIGIEVVAAFPGRDLSQRAAQTSSPSIKSAFEEVARGWLLLAEQMEWVERQGSSRRDAFPEEHWRRRTYLPRIVGD